MPIATAGATSFPGLRTVIYLLSVERAPSNHGMILRTCCRFSVPAHATTAPDGRHAWLAIVAGSKDPVAVL